jgi:3-oxoacyl-[acyl-carrier protein] reductase
MHNVLVTGGTRGLGLGIATVLADSGCRVVAVARREGDAFAAARQHVAWKGKGELHFCPFDLANVDAIGGFVKSLRQEFGDLYGLVNNAAAGVSGILATVTDSSIEQAVRLNVVSPLTLTKYVVRSMMAGRGGRIVNVSSIVSSTGYSGLSVYSATKASLVGFTKSLARELGPLGITVNAVAPGFVETEMTHGMNAAHREKIARRSALQRMPEVTDIADTVAFLISDKARNITGTVMTVDAGNTA